MPSLGGYASGVLILAGLFSVGGRGGDAPKGDFLIEAGKVGSLFVGMRASDIVRLYPRWAINGGFVYGEGIAAPVIEIRLARGQKRPSLSIGLDETTDHRFTIARGIEVFDRRFRTKSGIGPGSMISEVSAAFGDLTIESFEGQTILNSKGMQMSFEIEDDASPYDKDGQFRRIGDIRGRIPVTSVWVYHIPAPPR
jgi:hypothetical protein